MIRVRCKRCDKGSHSVALSSNEINRFYQLRHQIIGSLDDGDEQEIIQFIRQHINCPLYYLQKGDHEPIYFLSVVPQENPEGTVRSVA